MKRPKYLELALEIEQAIGNGSLLPGARLPSIRELMAQRGLSLSTVTSALRRLEESGLVEPRAKAGYFVKQPARAAASAIDGPSEVERVELDTPAEDLYPAERLKKLTASTVRRHPQWLARPPRHSTYLRLAKELARRSAEYGCFVRATDIVLTQGETEALSLALRAITSPGDVVLVQEPLDPWTGGILAALELEPLGLPASVDYVATLGDAIATGTPAKVVLVNPNFHCPTGTRLSVADKRQLLRICERGKLPIIEDDRYGDLQHEGVRPLPIKSFDTEGRVVYLNSCSRSLAPGLQIGWLATTSWRARIQALKNASSSNVSELSQLVLAEFLARGSHAPHLRKLRERLKLRTTIVLQVLRARLGARVRIAGGYSVWLPFHAEPDAQQIFHWRERWPELFAKRSPVAAFVSKGLYVNTSNELTAHQLAALADCCEAIRPYVASETVSPN